MIYFKYWLLTGLEMFLHFFMCLAQSNFQNISKFRCYETLLGVASRVAESEVKIRLGLPTPTFQNFRLRLLTSAP